MYQYKTPWRVKDRGGGRGEEGGRVEGGVRKGEKRGLEVGVGGRKCVAMGKMVCKSTGAVNNHLS